MPQVSSRDRLEGNPQAFLKEQYSALEEGRADLIALYFIADPKLVELDLVPADEHAEIVRAEYESYTRNAILQLRRIREGSQLEEDHMRNRQMIVHWLLDQTDAIDVRDRDGKTFYVMTDPEAFPGGCGELLGEVQRIKSQGDYEAAKELFETYGIHFDPDLQRSGPGTGGVGRPALVFRVRDAEAGGCAGRRRGDCRRHDLLPHGPDPADARVFGKALGSYLSHPGGTPDRRVSSWMSRISWLRRSTSASVRCNSWIASLRFLLDLAPPKRVVSGGEFGPQSVDSILQGGGHQLGPPPAVTR